MDVERVGERVARIGEERRLRLLGTHPVALDPAVDLEFSRRPSADGSPAFHPNNLRFSALAADGSELGARTYFSVGGGFVVSETIAGEEEARRVVPDVAVPPHPYRSAAELLALTETTGWSIAEVMRRNERAWRSDAEIDAGLLRIWGAMQACVEHGVRAEGALPGSLRVRQIGRAHV